jgi:hypothetical protein
MGSRRNAMIGVTLLGGIVGLGIGAAALERRVPTGQPPVAPRFEVDPLWPKPLPNHWILGSAVGVGVDSRDHVFIIHRGNGDSLTELGAAQVPPSGECCRPAPPILEFDPEGNLVNSWGGWGRFASVSAYGFVAVSQCSTILPFAMRNMSNHVVV